MLEGWRKIWWHGFAQCVNVGTCGGVAGDPQQADIFVIGILALCCQQE